MCATKVPLQSKTPSALKLEMSKADYTCRFRNPSGGEVCSIRHESLPPQYCLMSHSSFLLWGLAWQKEMILHWDAQC